MATVGTNYLTLNDVARREDRDGKVQDIAEVLTQQNDILKDMPWIECNQGTSHRSSVRTGLPGGTWRKLYQGVSPGKSTTRQVIDTVGMFEAESEVDTALIDNADDPKGVRLSEEAPFMETLSQNIAGTVMYGDTDTNPERFMGLDQRYTGTIDTSYADDSISMYNVFDAGGNDDNENTSIWLISWGPNTVHGLYPKGSKAGIEHIDRGTQRVLDGNSDPYYAYCSTFKWHAGFCVRDWRSVGRIANIDVADLEADTLSGDLIKLMIRMSERVHTNMGRPVWYMHERVKSMLRINKTDHGAFNTSFQMIEGEEVQMFGGIPVRKVDQLLLTENDLATS